MLIERSVLGPNTELSYGPETQLRGARNLERTRAYVRRNMDHTHSAPMQHSSVPTQLRRSSDLHVDLLLVAHVPLHVCTVCTRSYRQVTADLQYERRAARGVDAQWSCPHELITVTPLIPSPQDPHTVSGKQLRVSHTCTDFLLPSLVSPHLFMLCIHRD